MERIDKDNKLVNKKKKEEYFLFSLISGIIVTILFVLFLIFSSESRIFDISISGNVYLNDNDIMNICKMSDKYFLNVPFVIENKLKKHQLIKDAKVVFLDGKIISIEIKEEKLCGYMLNDEGQFEVLTTDNKFYVLNEDEIYLISSVPYLTINDEDKLKKYTDEMNQLDEIAIKQISEVHSYPFSYDSEMCEFIMSDGNYCFVSLNDINKISDYYSISFNINNDEGHTCIYIGDFTISAYSSTCPWQE